MADHGPIDPSEQYDDPVAWSTWYVGALGIFILVATVAGVDALFRVVEQKSYVQQVDEKVASGPLSALVEEHTARLQGSGTAEVPGLPGVTTKTMPIQEAMQQIAKEHGGS